MCITTALCPSFFETDVKYVKYVYFSLLGQLFLHRVFGYRGVLLFPWAAKVFDRDQQTTKAGEKFETTKPSPKSKGARNDPTKPKDSKISTMSYYQVSKNKVCIIQLVHICFLKSSSTV